jgi:hypothetical protein
MTGAKVIAFTVGGLLVLCGAALLSLLRQPSPSSISTAAIVTGIYLTGAKFPTEAVVFRSADGLTGSANMPAEEVGCHKGDTVPAIRTGVTLSLAPGSCRQLPRSPWDRKIH